MQIYLTNKSENVHLQIAFRERILQYQACSVFHASARSFSKIYISYSFSKKFSCFHTLNYSALPLDNKTLFFTSCSCYLVPKLFVPISNFTPISPSPTSEQALTFLPIYTSSRAIYSLLLNSRKKNNRLLISIIHRRSSQARENIQIRRFCKRHMLDHL